MCDERDKEEYQRKISINEEKNIRYNQKSGVGKINLSVRHVVRDERRFYVSSTRNTGKEI